MTSLLKGHQSAVDDIIIDVMMRSPSRGPARLFGGVAALAVTVAVVAVLAVPDASDTSVTVIGPEVGPAVVAEQVAPPARDGGPASGARTTPDADQILADSPPPAAPIGATPRALDEATDAEVSRAQVPDRGLVMAHWVTRHRSGDYSAFRSAPLFPDASTADPAYIEWAISRAQAASIDGFVATWAPYLSDEVDLLYQQAANHDGFSIAPMVNVRYTNADATWELPPDPALLAARLIALWERYGSASSAQHLPDGRMVVWAYQAGMLDRGVWEDIMDQVASAGASVAVMGGNVAPDDVAPFIGGFVYNSLQFDDLESVYLDAAAHLDRHTAAGADFPSIWAATVSPGMWDREENWRIRLTARDDGTTYRSQWDAARASDADWVFIVSWNEYLEDTGIEPTVEWGDRYLDLTVEEADRFRALVGAMT